MIPSVSRIESAGILLVVDLSFNHLEKTNPLAREEQF
jgi:hypothetical protein